MWEQRFAADGYLYGTAPNEFLRDVVPSLGLAADASVLCLAEGEGRNAVFLAECGYHVSSIDLTSAGVDKTLQLASQREVHVAAVVGDLATFGIGENRWDLVVSIFAHMPPTIRRDLHQRVVAALRPGGRCVLEAYTPAQIGRGTGGPSLPEMTMTLAGLRDELAPLEFVHAVETEREVIEGRGHSGVGSVVQVVARKST
jgi:hypothetical protein